MQTDGEFRERYGELLRGVRPGVPPSSRIQQARFVSVSKTTRQLASTVVARKAVFKTPAQKVSSASLTAGVVLGVVWFLLFGSLLGKVSWGGNFALLGGLVVVGVTWGVSMWRARVTGILDAEYVDRGMLVGSTRR